MKIFISVDMEGIAGVVDEKDTLNDGKEYKASRRLMTQETNAAIEGCLNAGARKIIVADSHSTTRNIIASSLNPEARLISGLPRPLGQMEGLDESFSGVFLLGYHSMNGTRNGVLDHSWSSNSIHFVKINGKEIGEIGLNTMLANYYGVPVLLVSGCDKAINEAKIYLDKAEFVVVKAGLGRTSVSSLHPEKAQNLIRKASEKAVKNATDNILQPEGPFKLEIMFKKSSMAEMTSLIPDVARDSGRKVTYQTNDFLQLFKVFRVLLFISCQV